jgi:hypothetical protein
MDPSRKQSDLDNDVHSLESTDGLVEPESLDTTDTTNTTVTPPSASSIHQMSSMPVTVPKKSLWRRVADHVNIYLLLFILLLMVAIAVTIFAVARSRTETATQLQITSQDLSDSTLDQLANSNANVGSPRQILTVSSNAVFAGSVLLKSNLEIAGAVKIGGDLTLPSIVISGDSKLGNVQADRLAISGPASFQGTLNALSGMSVTGKSTFSELSTGQLTTGSLQLNGDLKLTHHIVAGGPIPSLSRGTALGGGGTASVSGSDTAGSVNISTGSSPPAGCFATITFEKAFANTPHIIITPVGSAAANTDYYINRGTSNFSICTANGAAAGVSFGFDYLAVE